MPKFIPLASLITPACVFIRGIKCANGKPKFVRLWANFDILFSLCIYKNIYLASVFMRVFYFPVTDFIPEYN